jgi:hypothetical protein
MLDNALISLLASQLEAASAAGGWNYAVSQKDQPSQEGTSTLPMIYFEKIDDNEYGFPMVAFSYQSAPNNFSEVETQLEETMFQISARVPQDPTNLTLPTASDVVKFLKRYIQSRASISTFWASKVSMLRVTSVRNPYAVNDRERFEATPNFDIVLQHTNTNSAVVPAVSKIVGAVSPITGDNNVGVFPVFDKPVTM